MSEQMSTFNKVVRVLAGLGIGLFLATSSHLWGGGAVIIVVLTAMFSDINMYAGNIVIKRHWRKQTYTCSTCHKEIPDNQKLVLTSQVAGEKRKHFDTVECMREAWKEVTK